MNAPGTLKPTDFASYRTRLLVAMILVVAALTALGLFLAQRKVAIETRFDLLQDFQKELATLHSVQEMRHAALAERCRVLVSRPRIHAALEDNAPDLLYPSAKEELRDILDAGDETPNDQTESALNARFYRFLDGKGAVISAPLGAEVGKLSPEKEAQLALPLLNNEPQSGYLLPGSGAGPERVHEILAMPVISTETGEVIAALVLGFNPVEFGHDRSGNEIKSGIWSHNGLHLPALTKGEEDSLAGELSRAVVNQRRSESSFEVTISGMPHLLFFKQLNPDSLYTPAYEIAVYPLANAIARQKKIRRQIVLAGLGLLLTGVIASHFISRRLSAPVEELAVTSEENRTQRAIAEAALESTSVELERAERFSANASHQLKTPVTLLRAGIEELLARENFSPEVYHELSALLHQTYRITGVVDDLLLLSRMDAGGLQIEFSNVNLSQLLEEWLDDVSALPDDFHIELKTNFPPDLHVAGEKRYIALIVQNLLENARKYNLPHGKICVAAEEKDGFVVLTIKNIARSIPPHARAHVFERFHRGAVGENVPGHGLGLNLARELARLHGGDLRLVRSDEEWTEFEVRLRVAKKPAGVTASST